MRPVDRSGLRAPGLVIDLELEPRLAGDSEDEVIDTSGYETAWCLLRRQGLPVGSAFWDVSADGSVEREALREAVNAFICPPPPAPAPEAAPALELTVAICTRERPDSLRTALESLQRQTDQAFSTLVVDNAPATSATRDLVDGLASPSWRYEVEPAPGLSRARNTALAAVTTPLIAWLDDDETADHQWVARLKQGFAHRCRPDAVSGLMLPAELETEAQVRFEQYGGFNKGRGFATEILSLAAGTVRSPMYPLPNFGAGGNMAFRVRELRDAGGFDRCLGAGTSTHGGEETRAFALLLRNGGTILHWPAAVTWHYHRREMTELRDQFRGYSAGLSAFFASMLLTAPAATTRELVRVLPTAVAHARPGRGNRRIGGLPADFPKDLLRAGRRGFLQGAPAYLRERRRDRATEPPGNSG